MPLKHHTETFLVFALAIIIVLTGFLLRTLPHAPLGAVPALILLAATVLYPMLLLPFMRTNRADHVFRWLHWFPAGMVFAWLLFEGLALAVPALGFLTALYTWGWMLPVIFLGLFSLFIFCLSVLRRWVPRTALLLLAFIPYFALAATSNMQGLDVDKEVSAVLWEKPMWHTMTASILKSSTGSVSQVAVKIDDAIRGDMRNLEESEDPEEEKWRERLRAFEERRSKIEERLQERMAGGGETRTEDIMPETGTGREYRELASAPSFLPHSGPGLDFFALSMLAGYCGVLHTRARRRKYVG